MLLPSSLMSVRISSNFLVAKEVRDLAASMSPEVEHCSSTRAQNLMMFRYDEVRSSCMSSDLLNKDSYSLSRRSSWVSFFS